MAENKTPLLSIKDLVIEFSTENGVVRATDRISFDVYPNETVGIVGESGCGKTVTGLSILGLIPSPPGRIESGSIKMLGRELVGLTESELREIRGRDISMIFQEPMTALNPVFTVGNQMCDVLMRHRGLTRRQARDGAIEMLAKVGIPVPAQRIDEYPHQLSGGMRQRVMIAMALSCGPKLLIADEPTTALDVTTQAQVLEQISKLQREFHMAVVLITHDLGVVAETCDRAIVMYCGRIVESADPTDSRRPVSGVADHSGACAGPIAPAARLPICGSVSAGRFTVHRATGDAVAGRLEQRSGRLPSSAFHRAS